MLPSRMSVISYETGWMGAEGTNKMLSHALHEARAVYRDWKAAGEHPNRIFGLCT